MQRRADYRSYFVWASAEVPEPVAQSLHQTKPFAAVVLHLMGAAACPELDTTV